MTDPERLNEFVQALQSAQTVLFITGAGLSADSGLPTYRGLGGLYEGAATAEGYAIEDALSIGMLRTRAEICWRYLWQIAQACEQAEPNAGHRALVDLETTLADCWVLTQNIDGFHHQAGNRKLIEIHGRGGELYCMDCGQAAEHRIDPEHLPPRCEGCAGVLRPTVVLFGEMLPQGALEAYEEVIARQPQVVVSVGTSSAFPYISGPVLEAAERGAYTVDINPAVTELSPRVSWHWRAGAAAALSAVAARIAQS